VDYDYSEDSPDRPENRLAAAEVGGASPGEISEASPFMSDVKSR
jgi:hypothetical protein